MFFIVVNCIIVRDAYPSSLNWRSLTGNRMTAWGFNTLGAWSGEQECVGLKKPFTAELGGGGESAASIHLDRVYLPQHAKHTQLFEGNPQQAAAQLIEKLKFEARVI